VVSELDNNLPITGVKTQSETIDRLLFNERLVARLFGLFGVLGLVLACVGLYGGCPMRWLAAHERSASALHWARRSGIYCSWSYGKAWSW
jgi:hypothetical protein